MVPAPISADDIARLKRGYALYNKGEFDALHEFVSPHIVMERDDAVPVHGWAELRAFWEPDAFAWQRSEPLDFRAKDDKILTPVRIVARGAGSGVELEISGWHVWTFRNGLAVHLLVTADQERARAAAGLDARSGH